MTEIEFKELVELNNKLNTLEKLEKQINTHYKIYDNTGCMLVKIRNGEHIDLSSYRDLEIKILGLIIIEKEAILKTIQNIKLENLNKDATN